jgi:hypothetical protein
MANIIDFITGFVTQPEIILSGTLVLVVVCMLLAARSRTLPVKGLLYFIATGFGVAGIVLFRNKIKSGIKKEIAGLEEKIDANKKLLDEYKTKSETAEAALKKELADARVAKEACLKQQALISAKSKEDIDRIASLQGEDLFAYINEHVIE